MPTSSSNTSTTHSEPGRVGNNAQTNGKGETATRNNQRSTSTNAAGSPPAVYAGDLEDDPAEAGTRNLDYLKYFLNEEPQRNGNKSKA
ncbi:hypothetical protein PMIN03_012952 [Paraphaeosphaeria minitans]